MSTPLLPRTRSGTPRLRLTSDVIAYWAERIELRKPKRESFGYCSMICRGDSLFHYGQHFELARIVRTKSGRARLVILNGDVYAGASGFGPSTASRQREVRSAVERSSVPGLVVPFSALDSAGIDFSSIQPIEVRADRETFAERQSPNPPTKKLSTMEDPSGATKTETRWRWDADAQRSVQHEAEIPLYVPNPNRTVGFSHGHAWSDGATRGEDGIWRWTERRHWLGDCIFRARLTESRTRKVTVEELAHDDAFRTWTREAEKSRRERGEITKRLRDAQLGVREYRRAEGGMVTVREPDEQLAERIRIEQREVDARWTAHLNTKRPSDNRVRNGRVPITVTRWANFVSSFDYQEPRALYFLAELPHGAKPRTVDEAIESLKPPEVLAAIARGLPVLRHGDVFAIPTKLTRKQLRLMRRGDFTKRLQVLDTNHSVTEGVICRGGATLGRGIMRHDVDSWRTPDHVPLRLGDRETWHLLIRNTVPRSH